MQCPDDAVFRAAGPQGGGTDGSIGIWLLMPPLPTVLQNSAVDAYGRVVHKCKNELCATR